MNPEVTIIIPALNEAECIGETLRLLIKENSPDEVIVADGGSSDDTVSIAEKYSKVLITKPGRAVQMNAAAQKAKNEILLFLHADTQLPAGGVDLVKSVIAGGKKAPGSSA